MTPEKDSLRQLLPGSVQPGLVVEANSIQTNDEPDQASAVVFEAVLRLEAVTAQTQNIVGAVTARHRHLLSLRQIQAVSAAPKLFLRSWHHLQRAHGLGHQSFTVFHVEEVVKGREVLRLVSAHKSLLSISYLRDDLDVPLDGFAPQVLH